MDEIFIQKRKSYIEIGKIYFWTATINKWQKLLKKDVFKDVIINCMTHLNSKNKIDVFAFVVMPNHIHLIWRVNELNGKETAQASFLKYTAHQFKKILTEKYPFELGTYTVEATNKIYEFWQRDSLAIELYNDHIAYQKLEYLHNNPLQERWQLAKEPSDYFYSSAAFYDKNSTNFPFIKDLREEF